MRQVGQDFIDFAVLLHFSQPNCAEKTGRIAQFEVMRHRMLKDARRDPGIVAIKSTSEVRLEGGALYHDTHFLPLKNGGIS